LIICASLCGVLALGGGIGWAYLNIPPVVHAPVPVLPTPNAFDYDMRAAKALTDLPTLRLATALEFLYHEGMYDPARAKSDSIPAGAPIGGVPHAAHPMPAPPLPPPISLSEIDALVRANHTALTLLHEGFAYPYQQPPAGPQNKALPCLGHLADFLRLVGTCAAQRGAWHEALSYNLDALHLGADIARGGGCNSALMGARISNSVRLDAWTAIPHLSRLQARIATARMEAIWRARVPFAATLENERWESLSYFADLQRDPRWRELVRSLSTDSTHASPVTGWLRLYLTSKRAFIRDVSAIYDAEIANARCPYYMRNTFPTPSAGLLTQLWTVYPDMRLQIEKQQVQNALLTVALALQTYRAEHGAYPPALANLAPGYLHAVPIDPFAVDGQLHYTRTPDGYRLYSVGPDGKDNGGVPSAEGRQQPGGPRGGPGISQFSTGDILAGVTLY